MKSSTSNPDLSRPSSSRSRPGTPKHPSSKHRERNFILWIPEPLEDLENIIQSKQRTLDLLNSKTETLDKEIKDQLSARDRYITELNKIISDLKGSIKTRDGKRDNNVEKELEGQEKLLMDSRRENAELNKKLNDLESDYERALRQWNEEKEQLEKGNNEIIEDEEGIKGCMDAKEQEIQELIEAMNILQSTVEKLTKINSSLLTNVDKVNNDIKNLNSKNYEASIKASRSIELEKTIQEYQNLNREKETENIKLMNYVDAIAKFSKVTEWVQGNITNIEEFAKAREESLSKTSEANIEKALLDVKMFFRDTLNNLTTIRTTLQNSTPKISAENKTTEEILRMKHVELETDLWQVTLNSREFKAKESAYKEEVEGLKSLAETNSIEYKSHLMKMKTQFEVMNEVTDKFNLRINNFKAQNDKILAEIYANRSKLAHLTGKNEHFHKKCKEFNDYEQQLNLENAELKAKLCQFESNKAPSKVSTTEEIRVKKAMSQMQILKEELFRKDTDIVKKSREMIKIEKEIESQRQISKKLNAKMKTIEAEIISKVSQDLEEKDRQIDILKEMLRCAHSDIKLKDSQLNSAKVTSPRRN